MTIARLLLVAAAAALGGAINSIAGGGTLVTFPALVALGVPPLVANATSTVALWPGLVGSMWGYRGELSGARKWAIGFAIPSLLGGLVGALLLIWTPADRFSAIVPWLVLGATVLFMAQRPVMQLVRRHARRASAGRGGSVAGAAPADPPGDAANGDAANGDAERTRHFPSAGVLLFQFLVSIYGGYFGAGMGILMLAALGFMGLTNIHRMNGLKNWGGLCANAVAATIFAFSGIVNWPVALAMAVGGLLGGYGGSRMAQRVGQEPVRRAIAVIGLASFVWLLFRPI